MGKRRAWSKAERYRWAAYAARHGDKAAAEASGASRSAVARWRVEFFGPASGSRPAPAPAVAAPVFTAAADPAPAGNSPPAAAGGGNGAGLSALAEAAVAAGESGDARWDEARDEFMAWHLTRHEAGVPASVQADRTRRMGYALEKMIAAGGPDQFGGGLYAEALSAIEAAVQEADYAAASVDDSGLPQPDLAQIGAGPGPATAAEFAAAETAGVDDIARVLAADSEIAAGVGPGWAEARSRFLMDYTVYSDPQSRTAEVSDRAHNMLNAIPEMEAAAGPGTDVAEFWWRAEKVIEEAADHASQDDDEDEWDDNGA